ncbi:hypothetical protein Nepgr_022835 [Nepenthes gracilis]|uniref:Uncharacterized protein n=1 Tax=Nepenthes gracilis TaxID=150966 RepID=A0AAD3T110_NEPGR|nr:hypothetical protein Nepgr_022835 [Nepenthes gracilis]
MAGFGLSLQSWTVVSLLDESSRIGCALSLCGVSGLVNGDDRGSEGLKSPSLRGAAFLVLRFTMRVMGMRSFSVSLARCCHHGVCCSFFCRWLLTEPCTVLMVGVGFLYELSLVLYSYCCLMVLDVLWPGVADLLKLYLIDCYQIDANAQHACVRENSVLDAGLGEIGVVNLLVT